MGKLNISRSEKKELSLKTKEAKKIKKKGLVVVQQEPAILIDMFSEKNNTVVENTISIPEHQKPYPHGFKEKNISLPPDLTPVVKQEPVTELKRKDGTITGIRFWVKEVGFMEVDLW